MKRNIGQPSKNGPTEEDWESMEYYWWCRGRDALESPVVDIGKSNLRALSFFWTNQVKEKRWVWYAQCRTLLVPNIDLTPGLELTRRTVLRISIHVTGESSLTPLPKGDFAHFPPLRYVQNKLNCRDTIYRKFPMTYGVLMKIGSLLW